MNLASDDTPRIPVAPKSIQKGIPLKHVLGSEAMDCLARNDLLVHPRFDESLFRQLALEGLEPLGILERGQHLARALRHCLPDKYETATEILLRARAKTSWQLWRLMLLWYA